MVQDCAGNCSACLFLGNKVEYNFYGNKAEYGNTEIKVL